MCTGVTLENNYTLAMEEIGNPGGGGGGEESHVCRPIVLKECIALNWRFVGEGDTNQDLLCSITL